MNKPYAINIPNGAKDYLFEECRIRREIERSLSELFEQRGFSEIILPSMEYYDTFLQSGNNVPQEEMYKMIDRDGRILVLRPDLTTPIARVYATKLRNAFHPQRLYYVQNVFRSGLLLKGKDIEIAQAGIELIGTGGIKSDLEALTLAVASLQACGIKGFHIEIGHSGLFLALLRQLDCGAETAEEIRRCTEQKNYAAISDLIEPFAGLPAASSLKKLIELFGGEEILGEARKLAHGEEANRCIDYLFDLYTELKAAGLADYVRFDLGLVNKINYYTGIVFNGYAEGAGEPVLTGGRYDGLTASFGAEAPATGFGININAVSRCVPLRPPVKPDIVIHFEKGQIGAAIELQRKHAPGSCELSPYDDIEKSATLAIERGACSILLIDSSGSISQVNPREFQMNAGETEKSL